MNFLKGSMKRTYNFEVADKIRELLMDEDKVLEKEMFNGLCFMMNDKMLICVSDHDLLCRIGEASTERELEKGSCRQMIMRGRASKDFVYVALDDVVRIKDLEYWVALCRAFNPLAKSSKK